MVFRRKEGFPGAAGMAVDPMGRIWVVAKGTGRIVRFQVPLSR